MHIKNFLSGVVTYAIRTGALIGPNTIQGKKLITVPGRPSKFKGAAYSLDDIDGMLERVTDENAQDVIVLLSLTGLRQGEARGLRWSDFNEKDMTLMIERSHWRGSEPGPTKTASSEGTIPVLPTLATLLRNRHDRIKPTPLPTDYVFAGPRSHLPMDFKNLINRKILPKLKGSAIEWSGLHSFRRGLGTNLFDLGIHPRGVAGILRHDVNTSLKHYIKP
jgi:integrase